MSLGTSLTLLQNGAVANGNGIAADLEGFLSAQIVEVRETAGGTCTVTLEGSFDGTHWYSAGYQQTDATASLTRAAGDISVLANGAHVFQVLDPYPQLRARVSSVAGGATVSVKLYAVAG